MSHTLIGISGSLRKESSNTRLIKEAARLYAPDTFILADIRFPLYDGDLEANEGIPAVVTTLVNQIRDADAVVISTPEYNKMLSGVLKNALDWISREKPMAFEGKPVAVMSASPGAQGGARGQASLREALYAFSPRFIGMPEVMLPNSLNAFDDAGRLKDPKSTEFLQGLMDRLRAETRTA